MTAADSRKPDHSEAQRMLDLCASVGARAGKGVVRQLERILHLHLPLVAAEGLCG
jgi:hypothetical protein